MAAGRLITVQPPDALTHFAYHGDPLVVEIQDGWLSGPDLATLRDQPFVKAVRRTDEGLTVVVGDAAADVARVQQFFDSVGVGIRPIMPLQPNLDEIFVRIIEANTSALERAET
jgi:hypothetical protein